jgi:two-component system cell cycle response regulator
MITSLSDTESRLKGIEVGTDDFLVKPVNKDELQARIKSLIRKKDYLDQLRAKVDTALQAAITDKLTGIYNHGYFKHFLDLEFKRSRRHKHTLALLMIDVDDFKAFNDQYGHPCGDHCLRMIAEILRENVREIDLTARYGGEEFVVSLPYADMDTAKLIGERLLRSVDEHDEIPCASGARLSVSIGVSLFPNHADSPEELLRTADTALYMAKRRGKNQYCVYSDTDSQTVNDEEGRGKRK